MARVGLTRMGRASASVLCVRDKVVSLHHATSTTSVYQPVHHDIISSLAPWSYFLIAFTPPCMHCVLGLMFPLVA